MRKRGHFSYYIERLTVGSWLFWVLPYFIKEMRRSVNTGENRNHYKVEQLSVYYLNASRLGRLVSRLTLWNVKPKFEHLYFSQFDIRDVNDELLWWKTQYEDSFALQRNIRNHPELQKIIRNCGEGNRIPQFLMRNIMYSDTVDPNALTSPKMLFLIRVVSSSHYHKKECLESTFFFSSQEPWLSEVAKFAVKQNVKIISVGKIDFNIKGLFLKFGAIKYCIKQILYYWMTVKYWARQILYFKILSFVSCNTRDIQQINNIPKNMSYKIAVEYYGHLNLYSPDLNSDLFFCQQSNVSREDILIYFQHSIFSGTNAKWKEIKDFGISAVVINPRAVATPHIPVFRERPLDKKSSHNRSQEIKICSPKNAGCRHESKLIRRNLYRLLKKYYAKYDFWINFITQHNIKMHVSWYKHDDKEFAMWDALRSTGGVGIVYQRSFESAPNLATIVETDVVFGFSKLGAHLGKDSDSIVPYFVITGYLGDHRFPLIRKYANNVRNLLLSRGAKRILTYFDENSVNDPRWGIGHKVTQENYAYLLNKVLEVPWLGLILKPKMLSDLHRRLGDVDTLLERALETGRCFIFEEGHVVGLHPPATAALAGDIAVHGHFFAATAGVESALTGARTLMLDREGYSMSPLYKLGIGRVIFKNWEDLWKACQDYWNSSETIPGFGDWSSVLDEIDPFRDGRAAERMGTYLQWLMEGLKANLPRETVLADAAERYARIWGKDKILSINCNPKTQECFSVR